MSRHMREEKPYACSTCPVRFANKNAVAPHERTHTGEKPYGCSVCPVRFTNKGDVPRHERTHTGETGCCSRATTSAIDTT